ncbi:adenylate/guanylate cyclase domain-containing protein [Chondromyces apiculatus]|uniref:Adenylate/guanylate cyclase n=1 Tax=Chondromyces apiculatus DSM 436 TaxID=1192034 RepID=A0A017SWM8_9BACT|nr:adenylate/guanylate cyclase domain-containing protein [Chondromyces apiculatus]EYF01157.1 adenylate/guanylate cyclase [Chondromyces apiculatus DSM 436]
MREPIVIERHIACRSDPHQLWSLVTDTERLNRAAGLGRLTLKPLSGSTAARYHVATRIGAFQVEFEERPFEWVYPRTFRVLRRFRSGPAALLELSFLLDPSDGGTSLTVRVSVTPALPLVSPLLRMQAWHGLSRLAEEIQRLDREHATEGTVDDAPARTHPAAAVNEVALARAVTLLRRAVPDLADRLAALLREEDDVTVGRIRPFELADAWHLERHALLAACLHGVRAGMLELRWEVICPSCRTATDAVPTLSDLTEHGHCQLCELNFNLDLDEAVEAVFRPAPAVRLVDTGTYCIGGPARTPHVLSQAILPPSDVGRLDIPTAQASPGAGPSWRYRLFVRGGASAPVVVTEEAAASTRVDAADPGAASPIRVAPGGVLLLENRRPAELHAKLEQLVFAEQGATARMVTSLPEFRRDFSRDMLRPGKALKVSRVTLFFSDLTDSTLLYSRLGDAAAFKLVQDHFDLLFPVLEKHGGAVVKTIGDAIMATFTDETEALKGSLAVLAAFEDLRTRDAHAARTHLKLGLYTGPCYAIAANGTLDYFGQTVNIAARLQGQAGSGQLVVEAALADRAVLTGALSADWIVERATASLKGVDHPLEVARLQHPAASGKAG